jgi:nucleoside-diphosphate-sugar epimerase
MNISIIGLGWLGYPLALDLQKQNHSLFGTTRSADKIQLFHEKGIEAQLLDASLTPESKLLNVDVCVLNIPPFKEELPWFKSWKWNKETKIIFVSSTSVHGDKDSGNILREQEAWVKDSFLHWNILRPSGLIGPDRHPGRFLSGKKNLDGKNRPVNLIYRDDVIGVIKTLMEKNLDHLILDVTSDEQKTRKEFYESYCKKHGLPLPEFNDDETSGERISNVEMKKIYELKFPTMP